MHLSQWIFAGWLALACIAAVPGPQVRAAASSSSPPQPSATEAITRPVLESMYRAELGDSYDPVLADQLYPAHQLLEHYFAVRSAAERKKIAAQLEATRIDPNVLGRLCRIRTHWPSLAGGGVFYVETKLGRFDIRYFLGVPKSYDRAKSWPLLVKLAASEAFSGFRPTEVSNVEPLYTGWINQELSRHPDALVLMPLLDPQVMYGPSYQGMNSVMQPLFDAANRVNIDPARVYLSGWSSAALGVWVIGLDEPTYFAAINPLAGAAAAQWERVRLMNLRNTLPVIWHDEVDNTIKIGFARSLVTELQRMKIEVDFDQTRGIGHQPSDQIIERDYRKMLARVRPLYPSQVWLQTDRPDVPFNRIDWVQIYQQLATGKERHVYFRRGTGNMTVYSDTCSVKAEVHDNRIDVAADNVESMRFYLNDQMVNFAEPVTVVVNRKVKFKGLVKPSVDEMLKDQLFLGRGWRYYTAAIDIDMVEDSATRPTTRPTTRKGKITVGPLRSPGG